MKTGLVDTHCHVQDYEFHDDRQDVLARALETLEWIVVVGANAESSQAALNMAAERVYPTVGINPSDFEEVRPEALAMIARLACDERVKAIGEIGLDFHYQDSLPKSIQYRVFETQLEIALKHRLPVVIHCRDAEEEFLRILAPYCGELAGVVMHCFSGDVAFAQACMLLGAYLSFAGNVTYRKEEKLREAAKATPLDRLLVETDSPCLLPHGIRGKKRTEPADVYHTAGYLAELKGVDFTTLATETTQNARRVFGVDVRAV